LASFASSLARLSETGWPDRTIARLLVLFITLLAVVVLAVLTKDVCDHLREIWNTKTRCRIPARRRVPIRTGDDASAVDTLAGLVVSAVAAAGLA
jgi:hypothetical protein